MQEPFVKSNVYDLSGGLLPIPTDTGYNIVMPVYTPAGPLEKTKVVSQKDFLDKFMTSSKIQPNDHISAQFAYVTLASSPVYVMRACSTEMLEGMTDQGNTWLFDSSYSLLPSYKAFEVDLDLSDGQQYTISSSNQDWTEPDGFKELIDKILYTNGNTAIGNAAGILSTSADQIVSRVPLTAINAGKWEESIKTGVFFRLSCESNNSLTGLSYITINGQTYESLSSLSNLPTSSLPNNHAVYTATGNAMWLGLNALARESAISSQLINCQVTPPVDLIEKSNDIDGISIIDKTTTILANIAIPKGSLGLLANSHIKGRSNMGENWHQKLEGIEEGDIYIKNAQENDRWQYVEFTSSSIERGLGNNSSIEFELDSNDTAEPEQYPDGDNLIEGHAQFSKTGKYLTVKKIDDSIAYYNMTTGAIVVVDKPSSGYEGISSSSPSSFDEGQLGQTAVAFDAPSNPSSITVGPITTIAKSDGSFTPQNITDITAPFIQVSKNDVLYTYYNTAEIINPNVNILIDPSIDNGTANPIFIKNVNNTVSFVVPVLGDFINLDGYCAPDSEESISYDGELVLYVPTYGSAEVMGNITLTSDIDHNTPTYYYAIDANNNDAKIKFDKIQINVGSTTYYVGELPSNTIRTELSSKPCNETEFKALLQKALLEDGIALYNGRFVSRDANLNVSAGECSSNCTMAIDAEVVNQNAQEAFAVVPKFPCTENLFRFNYTYDDDTKIVDFHFNYKGGVITEDWTFSFVPGVTDSYGVDQWYTRVNSDYFQIVPLTATQDGGAVPLAALTPDAFGSGIAVPVYNDQYAIDAISKLPDYEDGIQYEIISDAGICSASLAKAIDKLTKEQWSVYPLSIPAYTKVDDVVSYLGGAGLDNFEVRAWATADRIPVGTFSAVIPGSYKCINKMIEASRSGSSEFAPIGGLNHGTVGMVNPVQKWKKSEREQLLDHRVCTVKGGVTTPYYINQNYTLQSAKSYMLEEQNVRMTNAAVHVVQAMAVNYLHELNTKRLRDKVQENVNKAIQDRLFKGKAYSPAQYLAVCDESNNTLQVIEQNKLVISLYASFTPSIHYVLIDHYIVSLDQISTNE